MGGENNKVPLISSMSIFLVNEFVKGEKNNNNKKSSIYAFIFYNYFTQSPRISRDICERLLKNNNKGILSMI